MTEAEGQKVLGPSMIIRRQTATLWELWPTNKTAMRMEDSSSFFKYTNTAQSSPRMQKSDTNFRRIIEPGLELARTPRAWQRRQC